jgi:predicted DNA-binding protein YlxM (UPF0122 family)
MDLQKTRDCGGKNHSNTLFSELFENYKKLLRTKKEKIEFSMYFIDNLCME